MSSKEIYVSTEADGPIPGPTSLPRAYRVSAHQVVPLVPTSDALILNCRLLRAGGSLESGSI